MSFSNFCASVPLALLLAGAIPGAAEAAPDLLGVAGKQGSGVAVGNGVILYSNTIHQL